MNLLTLIAPSLRERFHSIFMFSAHKSSYAQAMILPGREVDDDNSEQDMARYGMTKEQREKLWIEFERDQRGGDELFKTAGDSDE